jgi:tetratricopeptide (TPR) repeat protein
MIKKISKSECAEPSESDILAQSHSRLRSEISKVALLLLLLISSGFSKGEEALLEQANKYYKKGLYTQAIVLYRKLEKRNYLPDKVAYNLGNSFFQKGDLPKAAAAFRKSIKFSKNNDYRPILNLATVHYRLSNWAQSIALYKRMLRMESQNLSAWYYLAEACTRVGDLVCTQEALESALKLPEVDVGAVYQLSEVFVSTGELERAIALVMNYQAVFSDENDFWFYLGDLYRMREDYENAAINYRQGLMNDVARTDAMYKLADVYYESKKPILAMDILGRLLGEDSTMADAWVFRGNLAYDLKWFERAENAYYGAWKSGSEEGAQGLLNLALDSKETGDVTSLHRRVQLFKSGFPLRSDISRQVKALEKEE